MMWNLSNTMPALAALFWTEVRNRRHMPITASAMHAAFFGPSAVKN
jgi:hypothetical protein